MTKMTKKEKALYDSLHAKALSARSSEIALESLEAAEFAEVRTDYSTLQSLRHTNFWSKQMAEASEKERDMIRNAPQPWGVIYIRRPNGHMKLEAMEDISKGFLQCYKDGSSGPWDDDTYWVTLVPVKAKEDLPKIVKKLRKFCPNLKIKHTESVTTML